MLTLRDYGALTLVVSSLALSSCQLFGGASDDPMQELRQQVRTTVTDPEREGRMLESIDRMDHKLEELATQFASVMKRKRALLKNYDSTRGELETLLIDGSYDRQRLQRSLLEIHIQFKSLLTEEEWDLILPVQTRAVVSKSEQLVAAAFER